MSLSVQASLSHLQGPFLTLKSFLHHQNYLLNTGYSCIIPVTDCLTGESEDKRGREGEERGGGVEGVFYCLIYLYNVFARKICLEVAKINDLTNVHVTFVHVTICHAAWLLWEVLQTNAKN